jgi:hypothetical protein
MLSEGRYTKMAAKHEMDEDTDPILHYEAGCCCQTDVTMRTTKRADSVLQTEGQKHC